jgi:hypothetical protein
MTHPGTPQRSRRDRSERRAQKQKAMKKKTSKVKRTGPAKMLDLVCVWCDEPFRAEKPRKTCSARCRLANFRAKLSHLPHETAVCEYCGETFVRRIREKPRRHCSTDCANFAEAGIEYRPRPKTYAEISKYNREHPLAPGWRK